jgi:hypothetical protein
LFEKYIPPCVLAVGARNDSEVWAVIVTVDIHVVVTSSSYWIYLWTHSVEKKVNVLESKLKLIQ